MIITSTKKFDKRYKKLDVDIKNKFAKKIKIAINNIHDPSLNTHKLHGKFDGCFSINITGDIRAVFRLLDDTILFIDIGSHSKLYS